MNYNRIKSEKQNEKHQDLRNWLPRGVRREERNRQEDRHTVEVHVEKERTGSGLSNAKKEGIVLRDAKQKCIVALFVC